MRNKIYIKIQYNTALIEVEMITEEQYEDKLKFDLDNAITYWYGKRRF